MKLKKSCFYILFALITISANLFAQSAQITTLTGISRVDWTQQIFTSDITLDTEKAGFRLPANRNAAARRLTTKLPVLVKDPFLSLFVDSETMIDDLVRNRNVSLEQITDIIESGKRSADVFDKDGITLKTTNQVNLTEVPKLLARQRYPAMPREPIEFTASREYSGIIIDARGSLPVHGEYIADNVSPCFFPKIWNTDMDTIYDRSMVNISTTHEKGMVRYDWSDDRSRYEDRIGPDPLFITAEKVYGRNRTDPVIRNEDALRILTVEKNRELLSQGKVVILLDREELIHDISVPERNASYYALYGTIRNYEWEDMTGVSVTDTGMGIKFSIDLKFKPDSSELLQSEYSRLSQIAEKLKEIIGQGEYTILIEGHTADIGRPIGQQNLSIERTKAVMDDLVRYGLDESLFTYIGYGGTRPVASNDTEEGRSQNRRVDITARPKATYIQRQ